MKNIDIKKIISGVLIIFIILILIFSYLAITRKICLPGKIRQFSNCACSYQCNDSYQEVDCMNVCPNEGE